MDLSTFLTNMALCVVISVCVCQFSCLYVLHFVCLFYGATIFAPRLEGRCPNNKIEDKMFDVLDMLQYFIVCQDWLTLYKQINL